MQAVLSWLMAHEAVLAGVVVAVVDLLFAISPASQSNGILQYIAKQAHSILSAVQPTPPPAA